MLTPQEVAKHCSRESCWVIVNNHAYDMTGFLDDHPGGAQAILRLAGKARGRGVDRHHMDRNVDANRMPPARTSRSIQLAPLRRMFLPVLYPRCPSRPSPFRRLVVMMWAWF